MITVTVQGQSAEEIHAKMRALLAISTAMSPVSDTSSETVVLDMEPAPPPVKRTRKPKAEPVAVVAEEPKPLIVQKAEAIIAAETFPNPADAIQDAADEYAEDVGPVGLDGAIIYTLDDVRNAVKPYIDKWTIAVAQADVGHLIKDIGGADKISELDPANQENLRNLVAALQAASASDTRYVKKA
jgi:hypothetical protein